MNTKTPQATAPRSILREKEVRERVRLGRSSIERKMADGTFPRPIRLSERAKGWFEDEVNAWLEARAAERDRAA